MLRKHSNLLLLGLLLLVSCEEKQEPQNIEKVTIGTFNLSWLGDGYNDRIDRTEKDYELIADILKKTGVDVLAVQEVENHAALKRVLKYIPEFSYQLGESGGSQKIGLIFKKFISVKSEGEYLPLEVISRRTKPGLIFRLKAGNFDFKMLIVHLKATSRYDDTDEKTEESRDIRLRQAEVISDWANSELKKGKEKDLIIAGDFNDSPLRKKFNTLSPILANHNLQFITSRLKSCKYRQAYIIDHILVSNSAMERYKTGSESVYDFFSSLPENITGKISDHCPVTVIFNVNQPDND